MKRYIVVLLVLFSFMSMAEAEEGVINRKELKDIHDIVLETTGSHKFLKQSLIKYLSYSSTSSAKNEVKGYPLVGDDDGKPSQKSGINFNGSKGYVNTGIHPVVGKKRTKDSNGGDSLVFMAPRSDENGIYITFNHLDTDSSDNLGIRGDTIWSTSIKTDKNSVRTYVSDTASGLFPDGEDGKEVFLLTYFVGKWRPGFHQDYTAHLVFLDPANKKIRDVELGKMDARFPTVSVVAGDFDGDGTSNEFAVLRDGGKPDYYLTVWRASGNSSNIVSESSIYTNSMGKRDDKIERIDGLDLIAGDFNGDGKTELAAIYIDLWDDDDAYPTVKTFKWNNNTFKAQEAILNTNDRESQRAGGTSYTKVYHAHYGLIAEAGDLDCDGRDEIVFLTTKYGNNGEHYLLSVWQTDDDLTASRKFWLDTNILMDAVGGVDTLLGNDFTLAGEGSYLPRSMSLAVIPFGKHLGSGESLGTVFIGQSEGGDDPDYWGENHFNGDKTWYLNTEVDDNDRKFKSLTAPIKINEGSGSHMMKLVPADYYVESVILGENPEHLEYENDRVYAAEVQAPPYHVDFIQPDFPIGDGTPTSKKVVNISYVGAFSQYQHTQSTTEGNDMSFNMTSTVDWGVDAKAGAEYKMFGASTSGGYKETATKVEAGTKSAQATRTLTIEATAQGSDNVVLYTTNRHVWRYQILSYISKPNAQVGDDKFMTFALCENPVLNDGDAGNSGDFDDYNPTHEEGNLFSYPAALENIPYWGNKQAELSGQTRTTMGDTRNSMNATFTKVNTNTTTTTTKAKKAVNGSITLSLNIPKRLNASTTTTASYSKELTNTESYTKTYQTSDAFYIDLPASNTGIISAYASYSIAAQVYADVAGIMKVAFAVPELNPSAMWNRYGGVYGEKPDPALVLPKRFGIFKDSESIQRWGAVEYWPTALKLRGISFYDVTTESSTIFYKEIKGSRSNLSRNALVAGHTYKIQIPVYNASFVDAGNVDVEMRLYKMNGNADDNVLPNLSSLDVIDRKTVTLEGWVNGSDVNKAMVSFDWTVDSAYTESNYRLFFVIDPDNKIDEIHEVWDISKEDEQYTGDPGGNNVGYANIAILSSEPEVVDASSGLFNAAADDVTEDDFKIYFEPVRANDTRTRLTLNEFREELANMNEDFIAHATVVYSGTRTLTNVSFTVTRNRNGELSIIADRNIPAIFPNREYHCSFIVYPERLLNSTFDVSMTGDNMSLSWSKDGDSKPSDPVQGVDSSSSGCDMRMNAIIALSLLALFSLRTKKQR